MARRKVKSNYKRCPLLTITKKQCTYDSEGRMTGEETWTEFNDCYKSYCMAWDSENGGCKLYPDFDIVENDIPDDSDSEEI